MLIGKMSVEEKKLLPYIQTFYAHLGLLFIGFPLRWEMR